MASARPSSIGIGAVVLLVGAIGFLPLFDGPGYESALAAGLVVPSAAAITTALETSKSRPAPFDAFAEGLARGAKLAAVAWLVTMLHGLRAGFCDPLAGSVLFALGPGAGALLAGAWGAVAGEIAGRVARRRLVAVLVALAAPLGSVVVSLVRFYTSPMVFAYDPFVGYFSGSLYDTVIDASGLHAYRVGSAATLLAGAVLASHLARTDEGKLSLRVIRRPSAVVLGALAAAASLGATFFGHHLGHWHTPATIAATLGGRVESERCDVVYPRGMPREDALRFAEDCSAHVLAQEAWLETKGPPKITAYLFADPAQKGALMGAADTYIAKPWRNEVYVQQNGYPHPVLGHEIAHVMAGSFGRGPFRIAGSFGGLLPNPGLIEGIAVATSPHEGALSAREWAKAMKDLGKLPRLSRLFALGFLGENSSVAYTASGAFVGFVKERYGAAAVRAWYGGGELSAITGASWDELERAFHEDLDRVVLPEAAAAQARARFERPGIFGRRCPHVVDACRKRAEEQRARGDDEGVIEALREALTLDPGESGARVAIARALVRMGKPDAGKAELQAIADEPRFPRHVRDRALEELGDLALAEGDHERAIVHYREVMSRTVEEDQLRTLDVKLGAAEDTRGKDAIVALLVGTKGRGPDKVRAAEELGAWATSAPDDGLPDYLLARQYMGSGDFAEAARRLDRSLARRLGIPRVAAEAERLRLVAACALEDPETAKRMATAYVTRADVPRARREAAASLYARCTGAPAPAVPGATPTGDALP
ncbi:tetratricopeptide repeat protein [Polyangium spumosum]|uniref:Tetratricopeptide repeat protein n=1 Tax=Polyangium spumosum TaxID=889282 RepID=A0A6N7PR78_9BACT|nr:tetratricopeptide repeat protein [Polyangium spumosum]